MKSKMSDSVKDHFNTGLKLSNGWRIGRFPPVGDEKVGSPQNSTSQIIVKKGNNNIRMVAWDGRLGGGFRITIEHHPKNTYDSVSFHVKKYDEALENVHSLMRIIN